MALRQHPRRGLLRDQERAERGDLQRALDVGRNELDERSARARAGVVDDHVRRAVLALDVGEQPLHLRLVLRVAAEGAGAGFGAQRRELGGVPRGDCDGEPLFREQPGERRAQSLAGADDQRGLVGRRCHNPLLSPARYALRVEIRTRCYIANRLGTIVRGLAQVHAIDNVRGMLDAH